MISENTVLILGAGASRPYGYPTALELREEIIKNLLTRFKNFAIERGKGIEFESHPYVQRIKSMIEVFRKSNTFSIDLFLTRNKEYYDIGKEMIAFLLANYEFESSDREYMKERKFDWYSELFNIMTKDIINPEEIHKFSENKISIITFNYDRSFENFYYESLFNSFTSKRGEIKNLMNKFKIIHIYGKLAPLPWEEINGIPYKGGDIFDQYVDCSKNMKIIYDERKEVELEIITLLNGAKNIFFLGFGYGEENVNAIGLDNSIFKKEQRIYGTALGFTEREISKTVSLLRKKNSHMIIEKFQLENCDSSILLRNYL